MKRSDFIKSALGITTSAGVAMGSGSLAGCKDYKREGFNPQEKAKWKN